MNITFSVRMSKKDATKTVIDLGELDMHKAGYTQEEIDTWTAYGYKVDMQSIARKKGIDGLRSHLDNRDIEYLVEENVPVAQADELTKKVKGLSADEKAKVADFLASIGK